MPDTLPDRLSNNQVRNSLKTSAADLGVDLGALLPYSSVTGRGSDRIWKEISERIETFRITDT